MAIVVKRPGLLTTVQDLGRWGYQRLGVPVSGAMDPFALQVANLLVGNPAGAAGLEMTLLGPTLEFDAPAVAALCGADLEPRLNGVPVPMWKAFSVHPGDVLTFGAPRAGCRAYLAVAGGIDVPPVMGSRSTYLRGRLGGYEGRALREGDVVPVGTPPLPLERVKGRALKAEYRPVYEREPVVRVLPGPQLHRFTRESWELFLQEPYTVTPQSDRMGYRLSGPPLHHRDGADILSEPIPPGTIQVPGGGQPIVLMADRQTTGGYTKLAVVIGFDLPKVAQLKPGDTLRFAEVTLDEAHRLWRERARLLASLAAANRG